MQKFDQIEYNNEYIRKNYDRINFTAPKGFKEIIDIRAKELGYKNIGQYIKALIEKDLNQGLGGGGRRVRRVKKITFYSISLANFAAPRPRATYVGAPAFPLWLAWG